MPGGARRPRRPLPALAAAGVAALTTAGVAALAALVLVACSAPATDPAAPSPGSTGPPPTTPPATAEWQACDGGLECTTVEVPADWSDPDGPRISIAVARRPATSGTARGTVLVNPGGPGASGVDWLAGAGDLAGLGTDLDLVSWDPRGVGASTQLDCGGVGGPGGTDLHRLPTTGPAAATTAEAVAAFVAACAERSPALVDHLGTVQGAADMDAVRAATGAEQVDVVGFSYGTYLGLAYAETHPGRVRNLVLDAAVDPSDSLEELLATQAVAIEAALDEVLGSEAALWEEAAARTDPMTLAFAAIAASYDPSTLARLPDALGSAAGGDDAALRTLAEGYFTAATYTAYLGTLCADLERPTGSDAQAAMAARLAALAPRVGGAIAGEVAACAQWPAPNGRRWTPVAPPGVTIVVVGGTGDVATPLPLAESVAEALTGSTLVVRQGDGHVSLRRSACVADIVGRLLRDGAPPPDPTTCPG